MARWPGGQVSWCLPRLRKLYYANMKAVMEVLRARRGTSDPFTTVGRWKVYS